MSQTPAPKPGTTLPPSTPSPILTSPSSNTGKSLSTATPSSSTASRPAGQVPAANTPFRIRSLRKENTWLKMLVYGAPGNGKTSLVGSAVDVPGLNDVLLVSIESGNLSLFDNPRIKNPDAIDEIRITNYRQVPEIHRFLKAHCMYRDTGNMEALAKIQSRFTGQDEQELLKEPQNIKKYRTIIIDSLTELNAYCMYGLLGLAGDVDLTQVGDSMKTAEFKEYNQLNNMINLLVRAIRDLPIHFLAVCAQSFEKDELQKFHYTPALTGKLSQQVQGYFDVVGFMAKGRNDAGQEFFRLYLEKGQRHDAKCRFAGYGKPFIDNATMSSLLEAFKFELPS